jgi:hypothetical protein
MHFYELHQLFEIPFGEIKQVHATSSQWRVLSAFPYLRRVSAPAFRQFETNITAISSFLSQGTVGASKYLQIIIKNVTICNRTLKFTTATYSRAP